eukprot:m.101403 g.101403  ORF g.101403 m.101403 type:complete len:1088 (+) comp13744_c0_seq1:36-3299(+)
MPKSHKRLDVFTVLLVVVCLCIPNIDCGHKVTGYDHHKLYLPQLNAVICICSGCRGATLLQWLYALTHEGKSWIRRYGNSPPWIPDLLSTRWGKTFVAITDEQMQKVFNDNSSIRLVVTRDPLQRLVSTWKYKAACDGVNAGSNTNDERHKFVTNAAKLVGWGGCPPGCLTIDEYAELLFDVHRLNRSHVMDSHVLPQKSSCFANHGIEEWNYRVEWREVFKKKEGSTVFELLSTRASKPGFHAHLLEQIKLKDYNFDNNFEDLGATSEAISALKYVTDHDYSYLKKPKPYPDHSIDFDMIQKWATSQKEKRDTPELPSTLINLVTPHMHCSAECDFYYGTRCIRVSLPGESLTETLQTLNSQGLDLLVGAPSQTENYKRRMSIRATWKMFAGPWKLFFVIGFPITADLIDEAATYQDIVIIDTLDAYAGSASSLPLKTAAILWLCSKIGSKWLFKTDDDAFLDVVNLLKIASGKEPPYYGGHVAYGAWPIQDICHRWRVSVEQWHGVYPPYAEGAGYLLSGDVGKCMLKYLGVGSNMPMEDVFTGVLAAKCKIIPEHIDGIQVYGGIGKPSKSFLLRHHVKEAEVMFDLWKFFQTDEVFVPKTLKKSVGAWIKSCGMQQDNANSTPVDVATSLSSLDPTGESLGPANCQGGILGRFGGRPDAKFNPTLKVTGCVWDTRSKLGKIDMGKVCSGMPRMRHIEVAQMLCNLAATCEGYTYFNKTATVIFYSRIREFETDQQSYSGRRCPVMNCKWHGNSDAERVKTTLCGGDECGMCEASSNLCFRCLPKAFAGPCGHEYNNFTARATHYCGSGPQHKNMVNGLCQFNIKGDYCIGEHTLYDLKTRYIRHTNTNPCRSVAKHQRLYSCLLAFANALGRTMLVPKELCVQSEYTKMENISFPSEAVLSIAGMRNIGALAFDTESISSLNLFTKSVAPDLSPSAMAKDSNGILNMVATETCQKIPEIRPHVQVVRKVIGKPPLRLQGHVSVLQNKLGDPYCALLLTKFGTNTQGITLLDLMNESKSLSFFETCNSLYIATSKDMGNLLNDLTKTVKIVTNARSVTQSEKDLEILDAYMISGAGKLMKKRIL